MEDEVNYLQHVYNSIDVKTLIQIYKNYDGIVPPDYRLYICQHCNQDLVNGFCYSCNKILCNDCMYICQTSKKAYCETHFIKCPFCETNCVCTHCGEFNADYMCNDCAEQHGYPYSCGCIIGPANKCLTCGNNMDPINKERE